jgi:hypothetical protein
MSRAHEREALRNDIEAYFEANKHLKGQLRILTAEEWAARGEDIGRNNHLTIMLDGSPMYDVVNYGEPNAQPYTDLQEIANKHGRYFELGYAWTMHAYDI